jgi:hypothetical protein
MSEGEVVHSICELPYPTGVDYFSSWMRIAVNYADATRSMPVVRLDRDGLTVALDNDADIPPFGLPRRALIVGDSQAFCELRMVVRAVTRTTSGAIELIMQPSRADDDVLLWQALRAYQLQLGPSPWSELPPGSSHVTPHVSPHVDRTGNAERRREGAGAAGETGSARATGRESRPLAACTDDLRARAWCDAAFTVANRDDAYFFAHWLDYHFAELRARARMHNVLAELCDVHTRVTDHEVEVRFAFREDERVVRGSTRAVCRWIAAEAVRQLDMPLEHWLSPNMSGVSALRIGRPYRTTLASAPRGYPS